MPLQRLTQVGRGYCSLCDTMRAACLEAALRHRADIELLEVDLDAYPDLEGKFGEWVPVLLLGTLEDGVEICHYHFDEMAWLAAVSTADERR